MKRKVYKVRHWLYNFIPRHRSELFSWKRFWQFPLWALFGNDDDGIFGEEPTSGGHQIKKYGMAYMAGVDGSKLVWNPGKISFWRFLMWNLRNPLHNFTFYVIGIAWMDQLKETTLFRLGEFDPSSKVLPFKGSGLALKLHGWLPFLSFRVGPVEAYIGWRERGNFGVVLRKH